MKADSSTEKEVMSVLNKLATDYAKRDLNRFQADVRDRTSNLDTTA